MQVIAELYPDKTVFDNANSSRFNMFDKVCGTSYIRETFTKSNQYSSIEGYWQKDVEQFKELSKKTPQK